MLPKLYRLPGFRIPQIVRNGRRFHSDIATLVLEKTPGEPGNSRFTITVPVRLSKRATERNRTKRLLREAVHSFIPHIKPGFDGMVMAKKLLKEEKLSTITSVIEALLTNADLFTRKEP